MAEKFIPGLGLTMIPDPIDKSFTMEEPMTQGDKAGGGVNLEGKTYVNTMQQSTNAEMKAIVDAINKSMPEIVEKHELIDGAEHTHKVLKPSDTQYAMQYDDDGNWVQETGAMSGDVLKDTDPEYTDDLDQDTGRANLPPLKEPKFTKSITVNDTVYIPDTKAEAIVKAMVGDDEVIVEYNDKSLEALHITDLNPV